MAKYQMLISFETDKELSSDEQDNLVGHVAPQIEEPVKSDGDDEEYSTSNLQISLTQNNIFGKMKAKDAMEMLLKYDKDDDVLFYVEAVEEIK